MCLAGVDITLGEHTLTADTAAVVPTTEYAHLFIEQSVHGAKHFSGCPFTVVNKGGGRKERSATTLSEVSSDYFVEFT